jgi:hypothetical protein
MFFPCSCWKHIASRWILSSSSIFSVEANVIQVIFTWIPNHILVVIHDSTDVVDQEAMNALGDPLSNCSAPYLDFKTFYRYWKNDYGSRKPDSYSTLISIEKIKPITITRTHLWYPSPANSRWNNDRRSIEI